MTPDQFTALLARRDELEREHTRECELLAELAAERADTQTRRRRCSRLYDERVAVQAQIDAAIAAERAG